MPFGWAAAATAVGTIGAAAINASNKPKAPNTQAIADSSNYAADRNYQTSREQLDWAKEQYARQEPYTRRYMEAMTGQMEDQTSNAREDRARYESLYQPVENDFVDQARNWDTTQRRDQEAAAARADVATAFDAQRRNSLAQLESFGIDPSQTRFAALDLGTRIQQAATEAAAGTAARRSVEAQGLALKGEAINIGKGYPGQVAQSYAGATAAGAAGVNAGNQTFATGAGAMGNPTAWSAAGNGATNAALSALNLGYGARMKNAEYDAANYGALNRGIGQLAGAGLQAYKMGAI